MTDLPHLLEREVHIRATPETVFRYFTDSERWARWWGAGSTVAAEPGGRVYIRHPNGVESGGEVVELDPPRRFVFTYGFASGSPVPEGSSLVTIRLEPDEAGTWLYLEHAFAEGAERARDEHVQGWRFQLSLFANAVSDEVNADAADAADRWFRAWSEPEEAGRSKLLGEICAPAVRMQDRFSSVEGLDELRAHVTAAHRFMPGMRLVRSGDVRHCQGMLLADWKAEGPGGEARGSGTNVFVRGPSGEIESVTGFWG